MKVTSSAALGNEVGEGKESILVKYKLGPEKCYGW
jgi:hypothetical protein